MNPPWRTWTICVQGGGALASVEIQDPPGVLRSFAVEHQLDAQTVEGTVLRIVTVRDEVEITIVQAPLVYVSRSAPEPTELAYPFAGTWYRVELCSLKGLLTDPLLIHLSSDPWSL